MAGTAVRYVFSASRARNIFAWCTQTTSVCGAGFVFEKDECKASWRGSSSVAYCEPSVLKERYN